MSAAAVCGHVGPVTPSETCTAPRGHHGDHEHRYPYGDGSVAHSWPRTSRVSRGTTNGNARGSAESRRRRRAWLLEAWAADVDALVRRDHYGTVLEVLEAIRPMHGTPDAPALLLEGWTVEPACRCYRCGTLLVEGTVTVDRIVPGVKGGTYRRDNIRPACGRHNSETGARLASHKKGGKA